MARETRENECMEMKCDSKTIKKESKGVPDKQREGIQKRLKAKAEIKKK